MVWYLRQEKKWCHRLEPAHVELFRVVLEFIYFCSIHLTFVAHDIHSTLSKSCCRKTLPDHPGGVFMCFLCQSFDLRPEMVGKKTKKSSTKWWVLSLKRQAQIHFLELFLNVDSHKIFPITITFQKNILKKSLDQSCHPKPESISSSGNQWSSSFTTCATNSHVFVPR